MRPLSGKVYIFVILLIPVMVIVLYLNSLKYSISNITADNYNKILKRDSRRSLASLAPGGSSIFRDHYIYYTAKRYSIFPGYKRTVLDSNDRYLVNIRDLSNNNLYSLEYEDRDTDTLLSVTLTNPENRGIIANGKNIIDEMLLKNGFTYMESELKKQNRLAILLALIAIGMVIILEGLRSLGIL